MPRVIRPIGLGLVASLLLGAAAHAQRVATPDSKLDPRNRTLDKITSYDEMNHCQMKPNIEAARALLAATSMIASERHAARFKWRSCALKGPHGDFMKVVPNDPRLDELRWMSAEYFIALDPQAVAALQPLPRKRVYDRPWFKATMRHNAIDEMAACVADTSPAGIVALNKTVIGSPDERAALSRLKPAFASCLRADVKLQGERKAIRGALVEALYQRTQPWPAGDAELSGAAE
jgi:hypothetical protein